MANLLNLVVGQPFPMGGSSGETLANVTMRQAREKGLGEWRVIYWKLGPLRNFVARVDGMTEDEIETMKSSGGGIPLVGRVHTFTPLAHYMRHGLMDKFENLKPKPSSYTWESMGVGDHRIYNGHNTRLLAMLGQAIAYRRLPWTFKITRRPEFDDPNPRKRWRIGWDIERVE